MIELAGKKFGRLTVLEQQGVLSNGKSSNLKAWLCRCDCGLYKTVRGRDLRTGNTNSCGCYKKEKTIGRSTTHGKYGTPLHRVWAGIIRRCRGTGGKQEKRFYKGVCLCAEWIDFETFFKWAKPRWKLGLVIDRKDTFGEYSPENCRFVTSKANNQNSKRSKRWFINGEVFESAQDAATALKCSQSHINFMCHGRNYNGKYYPPSPNCYAEKKYSKAILCP